MRTIFKAGAVVVAVVLTGAGVASASVPDAGGVIRACYDKSSGNVRIIDTAKTASCKSAEKSLSWNQSGKPGPRGAQGNPGAPGEQGPTGPQGATGADGSQGPRGQSAKEERNGHCILRLPPGSPAGDYKVRCLYDTPFPATGACTPTDNIASPAYLGEFADGDGTAMWPVRDFAWQVEHSYGGSCIGDPAAITIQVKTFIAIPDGAGEYTAGFNYVSYAWN
ncbi:hypothetical protein [Actinoplanes sp. NPDC049599]|uniref:hypothetical protein n=1 Tax=Actinoplanes sp. NPDC049599 TaxID=3363903 RepID=UPI00379D6986